MTRKRPAGKLEVADVLAPQNLPFQMLLLGQQMAKRFQEVLRPHDLTPLHWGILCCLWEEDGLRTTDIATRLSQLAGTITVGLDTMQRRNLIRRKKSAADGRVSEVHLTEKAKDLRAVLESGARAVIAEIFAEFSQDEYDAFYRRITELRAHLAAASYRT